MKHNHAWFQLIDCEIEHVNFKNSCGKIFSDFLILKMLSKAQGLPGGGGANACI